jgi:hypothetical protein
MAACYFRDANELSKPFIVTNMAKEPPVEFRVTVIVPILEPLPFEYNWFKYFKPSLASAINALTAFSADDLQLAEYKASNLRVRVRKTPKSRKRRTVLIGGQKLRRRGCVELEWSVDLTLTDFQATRSDGKSIPLSERVSLHVELACEGFAQAVTSVLVASQIAQPGVMRSYELEIWLGKRFLKTTEGVFGSFGEIVEFAGEKAWPNIESLSIKQVWQWMCFFDPLPGNLGQSEIGRALNALTHLLSEKPIEGRELVDLTWAMIGLEALYGRGTTDLTYQLVEKARVLLGQSAGFEKSVKEMYRFRSLFIHGKAPFPGAFFASDAMPEYERHINEASHASFLAAAVLVASLQQIAKRNWKSLSFSFVVDEPRPES